MSIGLFNNKGGYFNSGNWGWISLMYLASMYGWEPNGTKPPKVVSDNSNWDSQDYSNKHSPIVTNEDALSMSDSIEKAIQDLADPQEGPKLISSLSFEKSIEKRMEMIRNSINAKKPDPSLLGFTKKSRRFLDDFVSFCRQGEFRIL